MPKKEPLFCVVTVDGKVLDCAGSHTGEKLSKKWGDYEDIQVYCANLPHILKYANDNNAPRRVIDKLKLMGSEKGLDISDFTPGII